MQLLARYVDTAEAPGLLFRGQSTLSLPSTGCFFGQENDLPSLHPIDSNTLS